jgi:nucleoid-associated protein YgaU
MRGLSSIRLSGALVLVLSGGLIVGCASGPVPPIKDPAKGEFYTSDEVVRLPSAERNRYCSWLETNLQELKSQRQSSQARLDSLKVVADSLRNQEVAISSSTRELSTKVRELRLREKASNTYIVASGDNLRKIARTLFNDGTRYKEIYEANKALIGDENAELKPGTRLTIPRQKGQ